MNKRGIAIIIIVVFLAIISFYFDTQISQATELIRNNVLNNTALAINFLSSEIIIVLALTTLFLWQEHKRKYILPLWLTLAISATVGFTLKVLVHRLRPYQLDIVSISSIVEASANHLTWNFSFPSSHVLIAFCVLPLLIKEFRKAKYLWVTIVILVGFSRIYNAIIFVDACEIEARAFD